MPKTFTGIPFKLVLPNINSDHDKITINTAIKFTVAKLDGLVFKGITVTKKPYELINKTMFFIKKRVDDFPVEIIVNRDVSFPTVNADIIIQLNSYDQRYFIVYKIIKKNTCELKDIIIENTDVEDKKLFVKLEKQIDKNKFGKDFTLGKVSFESYKKAVMDEMYFLKANGGKKYKVSNGKYISYVDSMYSYSFDLETELFISEESPITLVLPGKEVSGIVLMCEGFQIIILLESFEGKQIHSAFLSAAPWKLLQALYNRLDQLNKEHKIAMQLLSNVNLPNKAISEIPKGQDAAIRNSLNNPISIIWGPPGTGKTYTMSQLAMMFLKRNQSVLMVSHSNISVDGLGLELHKQITNSQDKLLHKLMNEGKILRYGYVRNKELANNEEMVSFNVALNDIPNLKKQRNDLLREKDKLSKDNIKRRVEIENELKEIKKRVKIREEQLASKATLLATTISKVSINKIFDDKNYDVVMFDEASMAYVPQIIEAAMFARNNFICVGDFRQLPPIAQSKAKNLLCKDIFMHLGIIDEVGDLHYHPWLTMLDEQRRMYSDISEFSALNIYEKLLRNHPEVNNKRYPIVEKGPFIYNAMALVDLSDTYCLTMMNNDNSRFNIISALISFMIAIEAVSSNHESIGIITPYQAQSRLIQALISDYGEEIKEKVVCSTVHQFQGSERDVIIFDSVESHPFIKPGILMRNNENDELLRLINVALTRARGKFITLANYRYWNNRFSETKHTYYALLNHMKEKNLVVDHKTNLLGNLIGDREVEEINCYLNKDYKKQLIRDIKSTRSRIILSIPEVEFNDDMEEIIEEIEKVSKKVPVKIKTFNCNILPKELKKFAYNTEEASIMPLILIGDSTIWYGATLEKGKMKDHKHLYFSQLNFCFRIRGEKTIEMIKSLTDIEYRQFNGKRLPLIQQ